MSSRIDRRTRWQKLLAEQQASGLSIVDWCWRQGIKEHSFYSWQRKLAAPVLPAEPRWLAVLPDAAAPASGLTLRVGHIAVEVVPGFDPRLLAEVLTVLESRC